MSIEFLLNFTPQETRVALMEGGVVQELHIERNANRGIVGNIYLGRVVRVLPGMQSAFVDIGQERTAFLHVADIWSERLEAGQSPRPIEQLLAEGEHVVVQVLKDPIGTKGARLSTQISLAGRLLVYLPQDKHIGISQRIEGEETRNALRARMAELLLPEEEGGYIVRTIAAEASNEALLADISYLRKRWREIRLQMIGAFAPRLLFEDLSLSMRVLRDMVSPEVTRIVVDSRENFQKLCQFAQGYMPAILPLLAHYQGERPLFELYGVEDEIQKALARRVDLKSGGYLIFDQTEAMTTIDVNTGGFVGARNFDETVFKTNLEAAQTIARQLRLRNLGGIIIIDFIDMESFDHRDAVLDTLKKYLANDYTKLSVNGFSALGLVEMTRKRTRESLVQQLCEPCAACSGRGIVKTAQTLCYEILREILREARQFQTREYRLIASPAVIQRFQEEESAALNMLSDFIGRKISLIAETSYTQEQFDIVLL